MEESHYFLGKGRTQSTREERERNFSKNAVVKGIEYREPLYDSKFGLVFAIVNSKNIQPSRPNFMRELFN